MSALVSWLIGMAVLSGPISNGKDFGSCIGPEKQFFDIRPVLFLQNRQLLLKSSAGPLRIELQRQHFQVYLENSPDGEHWATNIGEWVSKGEPADVFLTLGYLDDKPVLYWRETFQHRSFRQGLMKISPEVAKAQANWRKILTPICEGQAGGDVYE